MNQVKSRPRTRTIGGNPVVAPVAERTSFQLAAKRLVVSPSRKEEKHTSRHRHQREKSSLHSSNMTFSDSSVTSLILLLFFEKKYYSVPGEKLITADIPKEEISRKAKPIQMRFFL